MKTIGKYEFPENPQEVSEWHPKIRLMALHRNVLAVATTRREGTWRVYIRPVPGKDHGLECLEVLEYGSPQHDEAICRALFPEFDGIPIAR